MRRGFTLVEVLVATVIAMIVGVALLKISSSNLQLFERLHVKSFEDEMISIAGIHGDPMLNRTTKTLYDILEDTYEITNDELRKRLKDTRYDYRESVVDTVIFGSPVENKNSDEIPFDSITDVETPENSPLIQFEIMHIQLKNSHFNDSILQVRSL